MDKCATADPGYLLLGKSRPRLFADRQMCQSRPRLIVVGQKQTQANCCWAKADPGYLLTDKCAKADLGYMLTDKCAKADPG